MKNGLRRGTIFETQGMGREEVKRKKNIFATNTKDKKI